MLLKALLIRIIGSCLLLMLLNSQQWAGAATPPSETSLDRDALGDLTIRLSPRGNVRAVFGPIRNTAALGQDQPDPFEAAIAFFRHHSDAFSVNSATIFEPTVTGRASNGDVYVRFDQRYRGLKVLWRSAVVRYSDPSIIRHAVFDFDPFIDDISLEPTLNETDVVKTADRIIPDGTITKPPELVVYSSEFDPFLSRDVLAWQTSISGKDRQGKYNSWMLVIDANNGRILERVSNIQEINRQIYDASQVSDSGDLPGSKLIRTETSGPSNDAEINLVYDRSGDTFDYFSKTFQWESFDGNDQDLVACARFDTNNALYVSNSGPTNLDLVAFSLKMATKDIVTHEFTHGIIAHTAKLVYQGLSGAVNESFSDVFGAMHDTANWTVGEGSAVRNTKRFIRPKKRRPSLSPELCWVRPDHIDDTYCGIKDYGGVHHNSNILNHAAYEFAQVVGRGVAQKVYFDALELCLTKNSGFAHTRDCVVMSADFPLGIVAQKAFDHVGLSVSAQDPCQDDKGGTCVVSLYVSENPVTKDDTDDNSYVLFESESYILRDELFANSELGLYYTDLYYFHSVAMVDTFLAHGGLFLRGGITILTSLPGLLELTGASSVTLTQSSLDQIEELLKAISSATKDSSLSSTIDTELERFDWV